MSVERKERPRRDEPIEARAERIAARRRAEVPETRAHLFVSSLENDFFDLTPLATDQFGEAHPRIPRVRELTGAVVTTRWEKAKTKKVEKSFPTGKKRKGQALVDADKFRVIGGTRFEVVESGKIKLSFMPLSWQVVKLIPQNLKEGIEAAMRQQEEVYFDFKSSGVEQAMVEDIYANIRKLSDRFKSEKITKMTLREMTDYVQGLLYTHGLLTSEEDIRQQLSGYILGAVKEDGLGRINPMISRVLLSAAMGRLATIEAMKTLSGTKAEEVYKILYLESRLTRGALEEAKETIAEIAGFSDKPAMEVFSNKRYFARPSEITDNQIHEVRNILKGVRRRMLAPVKVAPYLQAARLTEAVITSPKYWKKKETLALKNTLAMQKLPERIQRMFKENLILTDFEHEFSQPSAEDFIMRRNSAGAIARLSFAHKILEETLNYPDNLVYTVFGKQR